ncbi:DUF2922 domain-containing protein [Romboutsia ilealis]|uniref:DUF2922 domain-containing protein n=1 Tax=Romboutsia faecis TaxID=2764597 RepID=A0ABR7JRX2_9FIRM|nr:DUF2922 domain-containing protein [Romboutsia faecis]MBC5997667.1 DUF2922 domain-containing protein [Romboutsia faecis]MRN25384.1 DUF2922 domain-containing protein [Romboutsia ilealis]
MDTVLKLIMTFKSKGDKTVNLTVDDPKDSLTESEIIDAMNLIIEKNIFSPDNVDLKEVVKAKVVQTDTTEFDLKL